MISICHLGFWDRKISHPMWNYQGKKDGWNDISKLYFPVWSPMWAQFSHPSVFWWRVIFNYIMLIFVHCFLPEPVFISVSLIVLSLFLSFFLAWPFLSALISEFALYLLLLIYIVWITLSIFFSRSSSHVIITSYYYNLVHIICSSVS